MMWHLLSIRLAPLATQSQWQLSNGAARQLLGSGDVGQLKNWMVLPNLLCCFLDDKHVRTPALLRVQMPVKDSILRHCTLGKMALVPFSTAGGKSFGCNLM